MVGNRRVFLHPAGNMRPPSKKLVVTPVKQTWDAVSSEVIILSFRISGIALNPNNGSEDKDIRCLIEGEVVAAAKEDIRRQSAALAQRGDDEDLSAGLSEDEERLETNELVFEDDADRVRLELEQLCLQSKPK